MENNDDNGRWRHAGRGRGRRGRTAAMLLCESLWFKVSFYYISFCRLNLFSLAAGKEVSDLIAGARTKLTPCS